MIRKADATPTKDFFVRMITRDISLEDCILDLIDNCIDGARRQSLAQQSDSISARYYNGFSVKVGVSSEEFTIADNCGGIGIDNAIDYAFHFGRRSDAPTDGEFGIGLYGIGMKRAILKIGSNIVIESSTAEDAFTCIIDVSEWIEHDDWEFDLYDAERKDSPGTIIRITEIGEEIAQEFDDPTFVTRLSKIIARDYALFLGKGLNIELNGNPVEGLGYAVREGNEFEPFRATYDDGDVQVEIIAGMAGSPPDDLEPSERDSNYDGWFVICNDRVVLPADKTASTVWGDEGFPNWHYQYYGFMGMVLFSSSDPNLLPWTTTKRDIDHSSSVYRRAITEMKKATRPWIEYTNKRKSNLKTAREEESRAKNTPVFEVKKSNALRFPAPPSAPKIQMTNIAYQRPVSEVSRVKIALGSSKHSNRFVGERTFEHYLKNEIED